MIPAYIAVCSAMSLAFHVLLVKLFPKETNIFTLLDMRASRGLQTIRFVGILGLVGLSLASLFLDSYSWLEVALLAVYLYAAILSFLSLFVRRRTRAYRVEHHLSIVLFVAFAVYAWRDVYPLATYTKVPVDEPGTLLWAKVILLFVVSTVIPLVAPREYRPADPESPAEPTAEQTASWLSWLTYSHLSPVIMKARTIPHLPFDDFPSLSDYDFAEHLRTRSFKHLDPFSGAPNSYLFWRLMRVFRTEYLINIGVIILQALASFASPVGLNRLLHYLETGGEDAVMRPWFWLLWLLVGPFLNTILWQLYVYISTGNLVRVQSIITQLIFEHALRIRMKAQLAESAKPTPSASGSATPNSAAVAAAAIAAPAKDDKGKASDKASAKATDRRSNNLVGRLNNLVTSDMDSMTAGRDFIFLFTFIPLQITLSIAFLYNVLGWSAFVGLATLLALFPLPGMVTKWMQRVQREQAKRTDARVQTISETMSVLRMVKLFGWESKTQERITEKREEELKYVRRRQMLVLILQTLIMKESLNASKVFSSMTVFDMLRQQLNMATSYFVPVTGAKVSLDRVDTFLRENELLDRFTENSLSTPVDSLESGAPNENVVGFRNAMFTWSAEPDGSMTPSRRRFQLKIDGQLHFECNKINLIAGPTGSGKTSLLMALLGEMHFARTTPDAWFNLPRNGGVAFAAQESWVLNVFGDDLDEERYNKVLYQCALLRDLDLFEAGDATEVGAKGITLSGGQKARVTLARAVYSSAEVVLLDDVLAALDVHTSKWIVEKCLKGDLMQGRTVLLVAHNLALACPIASYAVLMGIDGTIAKHGLTQDVFSDQEGLIEQQAEEVEEEEEKLDSEEPAAMGPDKPKSSKGDGKLTVAEEVQIGHLSWDALKTYLLSVGGFHYVLYYIVFIGGLWTVPIIRTGQTYWLGVWAAQYETREQFEVAVAYYLGIYAAMLIMSILVFAIVYAIHVSGMLRASRSLHFRLIHSVLNTTLRWLDVTPTSRIIARCTADVRSVDGPVPMSFWSIIQLTLIMVCQFGAVVLMTPLFLFPGLAITAAGYMVGEFYMKAQLSVKREMSNARAPVLAHFGDAIEGLTSIRAYGVQDRFRRHILERIDRYSRCARIFYDLNRWVCIRIEMLGALFSVAVATWLVYFQGRSSSDTGFSMNMAVGFSSTILVWIRVVNNFEVEGNLERVKAYIDIEHEPEATPEGKPPAYWPASGSLVVEKLSARYTPDGPKVLHDISFEINSGERVGVVGRTGSGKSSLTLSLLRCIYTEGEMWYDGQPTTKMNLDDLRSNITIIPQIASPELLSGSLRQNLDPFEQYDDATLNDALRAAGLFSLQDEMDEGRIMLDSAISSGGTNLSVGQRQIIALARAIVRNSKLLILDEATSAIDYKTDNVIQRSLRHELKGDMTLITIAHRLQTIMDADKIMVLDAGRIVEFDSPQALLEIEGGWFRALVDESGDKDRLYMMAQGRE
ncbi:P-loop containing nucleoside triphosphate hydrolase protein [Fistulina hepatica ATCC 64428]|uniref:p-loop containing nucleoside triphosphate hydrolase protein n=1 Tax=Fistulina hepatica ATCC 64428 TaxID=1128425 RepID=A0A0D7ACF7_9AGAR|nr:P-loop containing nucleoside triphosphate hydrolase protein [Fistulina hepatica ATCC 64428]